MMEAPISVLSVIKKVLVVLGVLFVVIAGALFLKEPVSQDIEVLDPSGTLFLVEHEDASWHSVREITSGDLVPVAPEFDGEVVAYDRVGEVEALIRNKGEIYYVLYRESGGEWQTVSDTEAEKRTLKVSADGQAFAYAERVDVEKPSLDILAWEIQLFARDTQQLISFGPGFAPYFVSLPNGPAGWEGLFFSTPYGVGVFDFINGSVVYSDAISTPSTEFPIVFGRSGKYLTVYDASSDEQTIFSVAQYAPLKIGVVTTVPQLQSALFIEDELFGITKKEPRFFLVDLLKKEEGSPERPGVEVASIINIIE